MHLDFSIFSIPQPLVDWNTFYIGSLIFGENHSQTTSQHCCASGNLDTAGHFTNLSSFLHWIPILGDFSNIPKLFADSAYFLIVGSSFSFWICLSSLYHIISTYLWILLFSEISPPCFPGRFGVVTS